MSFWRHSTHSTHELSWIEHFTLTSPTKYYFVPSALCPQFWQILAGTTKAYIFAQQHEVDDFFVAS